jgi:trk system potassium uptake protein TrkA
MGAPLVISRANDFMHQRILKLVGAHQIIDPEQEFGKKFANRLLYKNVIADTALGEDIHLTEICIQPSMVGKTLIDLQLPKRFGAMVVAVRRGTNGRVFQPSPSDTLLENDTLIIASNEAAISKISKGV